MMMSWWLGSLLAFGFSAIGFGATPQGNPAAGREAFEKLSCASCHSVYREPRAPIPLRDLSKETPEAVATMIVARTHVAPQALFDEIAMSVAAGRMTDQELADVVAYLRKPR